MKENWQEGGKNVEEYKTNPNFKKYVDRYCVKHEITVEEALEHELVNSVEEHYRNIRLNVTKDKE